MFNFKQLKKTGDGNCGKTSLLYAFKNRTFLEGHIPTIVETYVDAVCVDGAQVEFVIWDTAGQEEFESEKNEYALENIDFRLVVLFVPVKMNIHLKNLKIGFI